MSIPRTLKTLTVNAPIGGLNTVDAGGAMPATDALACWNLIAAEYGLRTRLGWREWCTSLGAPDEIRAILPFTGSHADGSTDKLFAAGAGGIYDVTSSMDAPPFAIQAGATWTSSSDAGWASCVTFVTTAGHFLVVADEANGAYVYSESSGTWTRFSYNASPSSIGQINGSNNGVNVDPTKFVHVTCWKNMLWFTERGSGRAWYLPVGSLSGTAYAFTFGTKFRAGGDLRCLTSWTRDGAAGIDDGLVAVSGAGDVVVYMGSDPSQASGFFEVGCWFVGAVPAGRRLMTEMGGDVLLQTAVGLLPISQLSSGQLISAQQYQTFKVSNLFNQLQAGTSSSRGWAAKIHPLDNSLLVLIPSGSSDPGNLLAMHTATKGWSQYRGLPIGVSMEVFKGTLYFGTEDGRVCINDGYVDGATLAGDPGGAISWSLITAFSDLGRPTFKRVQLIRPQFMSQGAAPQYVAQARYGWDLTEATPPTSFSPSGTSAFDSAVWDTSPFAGNYVPQQSVFGAQGMGPKVALALAGKANTRITLISVDVGYDEGGIL